VPCPNPASRPSSSFTANLPPGSLLALYTDGLVETRDADINVGIDRLRTYLFHATVDSLDDLAESLLWDACRAANRRDDIALLLTQYTD
jgi:serine phosphatase RsbU (regulator of sigma subunit)